MKTSLSFLPVFLACMFYVSQSANAQVYVGLKGMIGATTLENAIPDNSEALTYKSGFSKGFGAFANLPVARHFSLHVDAGYVLQGGCTEAIHAIWQADQSQDIYTDCMSDTRLHYLSAGVMLRYRFMLGKGWAIYMQGGPAEQLLVKAEQADIGYGNVYESAELNAPISFASFYEVRNARSQYRSWNTVIGGGLGVIWEKDGDCATLEVGTSRGLSAIEKDRAAGSHTTALYSVTLGYGFLLNWNSKEYAR